MAQNRMAQNRLARNGTAQGGTARGGSEAGVQASKGRQQRNRAGAKLPAVAAAASQGNELLQQRLNKVKGQLEAVERALHDGRECSDQLMLLAAVRGGVNALMATVLETHIRDHMTEDGRQRIAPDLAEDLLQLVRTYLK